MADKDDKKAKVIDLLKAVKPRTPRQRPGGGASQTINGNHNIQAGGDIYISKRETVRNEVKPGPEHISEEQAFQLSELVKEAVERDGKSGKDTSKLFAAWWNKLKKRFRVASYRMIPREQGDEAVSWMRQQVAILRPKLRRTDNDAWRKSHYATINASLKTLGKDKTWFYDLVFEKTGKRITSTADLGEQNLEKMAGVLRRMTK
jgi:hypothetical protein